MGERCMCTARQQESISSEMFAKLDELMSASHTSCSTMYQCSSPGLDKLVELSTKFGSLGARLTGAGWGGCIVALVNQGAADDFIESLKTAYYGDMGLEREKLDSAIFVTKPGQGASVWEL